jgi:hypothetical protein
MDTLDLNKLTLNTQSDALPAVSPTVSAPPPKRRSHYRFLKGPVSLTWLARAAALPGKALAVGIILWHLHGMRRDDPHPIPLGNNLPKKFGISRSAKYRALQWLANAGLVDVDQKTGRNPLVRLIPVAEEA